jgi:3-oxoacyl-(acyl-carrier-protein) synthase
VTSFSVLPRADVIGYSLATPLGCDLEDVVPRLMAGERAARPNPHFPAETYGCNLAAPILEEPPRTPHDRVLRRMGRFGYSVAQLALAMADVELGPRLGLFSGIGGLRAHWNDMLPALADQQASFDDSWKRGLRRLHPFWMLQHLSNNAHALLSKEVDARGEGATYGGANAGAQALASAIWALEARAIDAALVVAYDSLIEPETLVEMVARGAVTPSAPGELVSPYDPTATGFVPGEAAAAVVLCRPGEVSSGALASIRAQALADGSQGAPDRKLVTRAIEGMGNVAVIDGCGLGDAAFDAMERDAVSGSLAEATALTAVQAATGQMGAAAALVQGICLASCLRRGTLPPIAGLASPADGPLTPILKPTQSTARIALCLSAGAPGLISAVSVHLPGETP